MEPIGADGPLSGVVVVDLTRALAGPYATMLLADLGARVIKVESPAGGDDARAFPPFVEDRSLYFASVNRDKESIALHLKDEADRAVLDRLITRADVLVENFRPGVMARLGYGWEVLRGRHPGLVMASISGFGQTGPYAARTAYDMVAQAMGGIMSITGEEGGEPARVGISIGDIAAGLFASVGILAALRQRERTGVGSLVDIAMLDCQAALLENAIARHLAIGETPGRIGARHPSITPFGLFQAQDGHLAICVGNKAQFAALARAIGRPGMATDPRYASMPLRNAHHAELKQELDAVLGTAPRAHWLALFEAAGIPGGPLNDVADLVADPQIAARGMIVETEGERTRLAAMPVRVSTQQRRRPRPAPRLDADREAVLRFVSSTTLAAE
ncbi:CaiB/BaiF CoA transferase family protein [Falsiroseomonas sp. HW251]|uniref:CaiB/BaiF CoA transferase family protein n=1 Tax=Falsiroseomonas sp. HW251 TaxID=3390998 RepID=UPI003D31C931